MHGKSPKITPGLTQMSVSNIVLMQFMITYSFASSYVKIFSVGWVVGRLGEIVPVLATQTQAEYTVNV